jgi:hypothetical protein
MTTLVGRFDLQTQIDLLLTPTGLLRDERGLVDLVANPKVDQSVQLLPNTT